jgi:hypothetical protein
MDGYAPHCDARVLHAPNVCEYCDRYPDYQELRKRWGIAFTGQTPKKDQVPCPADAIRPPGSDRDHRRWAGNVATTEKPVDEIAASKMIYGRLWE